MYLLISTKINISVISIRISEDHYGSNLRIEVSALLAREVLCQQLFRNPSASRVALVDWPYYSPDNRLFSPSSFLL